MTQLEAGQTLLLNKRLWTLRRIESGPGRHLRLEVIGGSEAALGMARRLEAVQYGAELFISRRRGGYWRADLAQDWVDTERGPLLQAQPASALELLDAHTRSPGQGDLAHQFSWSYSREAKYRHCPRLYYYHYYAAWEGWRNDAPEPVRQAYLLKNLTDIERWVGLLVHDALKFALNRLKAGQPVRGEVLLAQTHRRAQADFEDSRSGRYRQKPNQRVGFQEHYYQTPTPPSAWQKGWQKAEASLRRFLDSSLYRRLSALPPPAFLEVETLQSFKLAHTTVWVQIDLATREENTLYLYDWKTGPLATEAALRQQLGLYGLYLRQTQPELPLRGVVYQLAEARQVEVALDDATLQTVQTEAKESIGRLQQLLQGEPAHNRAALRRFPMISDLSICSRCQFRALCGRD